MAKKQFKMAKKQLKVSARMKRAIGRVVSLYGHLGEVDEFNYSKI